jgi:hypothetical protein
MRGLDLEGWAAMGWTLFSDGELHRSEQSGVPAAQAPGVTVLEGLGGEDTAAFVVESGHYYFAAQDVSRA